MPAQDVAGGVALAAIALAGGSVGFVLLSWLPALGAARAAGGGDARRAQLAEGDAALTSRVARLVLGASLAGLAAAVVILAGGELAQTRGPLAWAIAAASFVVLAGLALRARRAPPAAWRRAWPWAAAAAALTLVPGLAGHAGGEDPAVLLVPASAVHVGAASLWAGGIACLLLAVPAGTAPLRGGARSELLAEVAARFSAVALIAVVALALTGLIQGVALVGRIDALATTGYGRLVLLKGALLCVLALAGAAHRARTLPALRAAAHAGEPPGPAGGAFRRLLAGEAAVLVAVFAATAVLAAITPAAERQGGTTATARGTLGPYAVTVVAHPGQPGDNRLTITLRGAAPVPARIAVSARQRRLGLGPVRLRARRVAPGRFSVSDAPLPAPGTWELTIAAAESPPARVSLRLR